MGCGVIAVASCAAGGGMLNPWPNNFHMLPLWPKQNGHFFPQG